MSTILHTLAGMALLLGTAPVTPLDVLTVPAVYAEDIEVAVPDMIASYAKEYGVDEKRLEATVRCESSLNPLVQSAFKDPTGPDGREDSWGLAQIHLPDHKTISKEQATDPDFALNFMAANFAKGEAVRRQMWGCYRHLYPAYPQVLNLVATSTQQ